MKKLILAIVLLTLNSLSYACECSGPKFTDQDREEAVISFIENKMKLDTKDLRGISSQYVGPAMRFADYLLFAGVSIEEIFTGDEQGADCVKTCTEEMTEKHVYLVSYIEDENEDIICTVPLIVKMKSNLIKDGFKSVVTRSHLPACH